MYMIAKKLIQIFLIVGFIVSGIQVWADDWDEVSDKHFIVHYDKRIGTEQARQTLRKAEEYYSLVAQRLGYARYTDYWTWEQRVKIIVYADQSDFMANTGQPPWSLGYADRDVRLLNSRAIVTYLQEQDFFEGVLPHEIGHLILRDFVGPSATIPLWFDEGVAQSQESQKVAFADQLMPRLIVLGRYLPLDQLVSVDIRSETDKLRVRIFYAQSVSVVNFLIKNYGHEAFGRLCRSIGEGNSFERSLAMAYASSIGSIKALENKWIDSQRR